ncbi:MAG: phycoerythrobilin:ferredoxin oxidoreductase [Microcoleus sp.]
MTLYQPFLDYAIPLITERLDLAPYPIPAGFEHKECITGKGKKEQLVVTTSHAFKSSKLRQIRAAHVQGGDALQVLNFVIFPQINYDLPFFGADLVTLPGGHLIALDMQPLFHDAAYQQQYSDPILPIFNKYQTDLPWGGDFPEEAKQFFSPAFLWTRPKETEAVQTTVFAAFQDYLQAYLDLVDRAQPVTDSQRLAEILQAQRNYINYRAAKDPARGMFLRFLW